jgi:hypothetical protein
MKTYFVSGHRNITTEEFDVYYVPKIKEAVEKGHKFVVGDYHGADTMAQKLLKDLGSQHVTVYHMLENPRNNAGFPTRGGFISDEQRDWAMTFASDEDILWVRDWNLAKPSGTQLNAQHRKQLSSYCWYELEDYIKIAIQSLEGLHCLINERYSAGYRRKERLREFYVLGFLSLDTCGNCLKLSNLTAFDFTKLPPVLTREAYWEELQKLTGDKPMLSFGYNGGEIPGPGLKCAYCGKGWTIDNCCDTTTKHREMVIPGNDYVGKTLAEVDDILSYHNNGVFRLDRSFPIRNDKYIDLSPRWPDEKEEWAKKVFKNEKGWLGDGSGHKLGNDFQISEGDDISINVWEMYHRACNEERLSNLETEKFTEVFQKAGFQKYNLTPIHNEYCPEPASCTSCAPWFLVDTEIGQIKIGWRKRVINIDWSNCRNDKELCLTPLFKTESTTVGDTYVHAWGWDKAIEYLHSIREAII